MQAAKAGSRADQVLQKDIFLLVLCGSLPELYQHELSAWIITANLLNLKYTSGKPIHSTDIDIIPFSALFFPSR